MTKPTYEELQRERDELRLELITRMGELQTMSEQKDELEAHVERLRDALSEYGQLYKAKKSEQYPMRPNNSNWSVGLSFITVSPAEAQLESGFIDADEWFHIHTLPKMLKETPAQSLNHIKAQVEDETIERYKIRLPIITDDLVELFYPWLIADDGDGYTWNQAAVDFACALKRDIPRKYANQPETAAKDGE